MGEVRVHRGGDDLTADLLEVVCSVTESDDLGRTNEGEVQWIEEKDDIFPCSKIKNKNDASVAFGNYRLFYSSFQKCNWMSIQ